MTRTISTFCHTIIMFLSQVWPDCKDFFFSSWLLILVLYIYIYIYTHSCDITTIKHSHRSFSLHHHLHSLYVADGHLKAKERYTLHWTHLSILVSQANRSSLIFPPYFTSLPPAELAQSPAVSAVRLRATLDIVGPCRGGSSATTAHRQSGRVDAEYLCY